MSCSKDRASHVTQIVWFVGNHLPSEELIRVENTICKATWQRSKNSLLEGIRPLRSVQSLDLILSPRRHQEAKKCSAVIA